MLEGYQFAHIELWSNKGKTGEGAEPQAKRKNGQRRWTAQEIFDEAERLAGASAHIIPGRPGPQMLPRAVATFADMRKMQEEASQVQEAYIKRSKGRKPVTKTRKLRNDAATLYASVYSLPVLTEEALADPKLKEDALDVLEQALEWECERISKVGGVVLAGVVHWDEQHLHLHVYAVDPVRGRIDHLHPGRVAKDAVNNSGEEKSKDRGKRANVAYCDAMRAWQDDLHREVFEPAGLLRIGPGRARWSREEYGRAKALARDVASREQQFAEFEAWDHEQEERQKRLDAREKALARQKADVTLREAAVATQTRRAKDAEADAEALRAALDRGSLAVAHRELDYREGTEKSKEGLEFGPGAPKSESQKKRLMDIVQPAYDFVVDLAKKAFNIRSREKRVAMAEAQSYAAAAAITEARRQAGQFVPEPLVKIIESEPLPYVRESFPDALFVERGSDVGVLGKQLDEMSNATVRRTWVATWQSMEICDERPDLAKDLNRGVQALEEAARQRGFDLETGKHHPERATDPQRARLHVDAEPDPIRIIWKDRKRVRMRG